MAHNHGPKSRPLPGEPVVARAPTRGVVACGLALVLLSSCTRPLGAVFDTPPSAGLPEVIRDAPWPMEGRCPGRTHYTPVAGPRRPEVAWTLPDAAVQVGISAIVDAEETLYLLTNTGDPQGSGTLSAIDASGTVLWTRSTGSPVFGSPALGAGRTVHLSLPYSLAALGPDGGSRGEATYGNWPPSPADFLSAGSPVVDRDGGLLASTFRFVVSVDPGLAVTWEQEWTDRVRTGAALDAEGRALVLTDRGWDLGYPAIGLVRFDALGGPEELAVLEGDRGGTLAVDADSAIYVVADQPHREPEQALLAYHFSAEGELLYSFEDEKMDDLPALALGPGPVLRLAWNDPDWRGRVVELSQSGARNFDTRLEKRIHGQLIVDGEGWTYIGGTDGQDRPAVHALDATGELRWTLSLPGDIYSAMLLAMGGWGRLYAVANNDLVAIDEAP